MNLSRGFVCQSICQERDAYEGNGFENTTRVDIVAKFVYLPQLRDLMNLDGFSSKKCKNVKKLFFVFIDLMTLLT